MTYKSFFTWHSFDFRMADSKIAACLSRQLYLKLKERNFWSTLFLAVLHVRGFGSIPACIKQKAGFTSITELTHIERSMQTRGGYASSPQNGIKELESSNPNLFLFYFNCSIYF